MASLERAGHSVPALRVCRREGASSTGSGAGLSPSTAWCAARLPQPRARISLLQHCTCISHDGTSACCNAGGMHAGSMHRVRLSFCCVVVVVWFGLRVLCSLLAACVRLPPQRLLPYQMANRYPYLLPAVWCFPLLLVGTSACVWASTRTPSTTALCPPSTPWAWLPRYASDTDAVGRDLGLKIEGKGAGLPRNGHVYGAGRVLGLG